MGLSYTSHIPIKDRASACAPYWHHHLLRSFIRVPCIASKGSNYLCYGISKYEGERRWFSKIFDGAYNSGVSSFYSGYVGGNYALNDTLLNRSWAFFSNHTLFNDTVWFVYYSVGLQYQPVLYRLSTLLVGWWVAAEAFFVPMTLSLDRVSRETTKARWGLYRWGWGRLF